MVAQIRIYVASLADYNAGILHGAWIDATQDADTIKEEIAAMLKESTYHSEEWAIHDHEGFEPWRPSESESIDVIATIAQLIDKYDGAFSAYIDDDSYNLDDRLDELEDAFSDAYAGEYDSLQSFAEELLEDMGELKAIPENLRRYFDYESYARDLELGGDVWTADSDGRVHVFWNR